MHSIRFLKLRKSCSPCRPDDTRAPARRDPRSPPAAAAMSSWRRSCAAARRPSAAAHTHTHVRTICGYMSSTNNWIQYFYQLCDVEHWCRSISRSLNSRYSQRWARRSRPESAASRCRSRSEGDTVSASISEASWEEARDWRAWVTWDWPPRGWGDGPLTAGLDQDHCSRSRSHTSLLLRHKHTSWSTRPSAHGGAQSVIRTSAARPESLRTPPWCCRSPRTSGLPWAAARESSRCSSTCGRERGGVTASDFLCDMILSETQRSSWQPPK